MWKCGVDIITKWMVKICQVALEGGMPADWTKAIIIPVYKGKGRRGECGSYRGIKSVEYTQKGIWKSHNRGGATTYRRENQ